MTTDDGADNDAGFMNPQSSGYTLQLAGLIGLLTFPQTQSSMLPGKIGSDSPACVFIHLTSCAWIIAVIIVSFIAEKREESLTLVTLRQ